MFPVFPKTIDGVRSGSALNEQVVRDYLDPIEYHLRRAEEAHRQCNDAVSNIGWNFVHNDPTGLVLTPRNLHHLIWFGDIAIREGVSVIDTCLMLVNHLMQLNIAQIDVRWRKVTSALRAKAKEASSRSIRDLATVIDRVYASIGYELLNGYRDWTTHRGAPRLILPAELVDKGYFSVEIPEDVNEGDPNTLGWRMRRFLLTFGWMKIAPNVLVQCWPFFPQVKAVVNISEEEARKGVNIPGIVSLAEGSSVTIQDTKVLSGSLLDEASVFRRRNPIIADAQRVAIAGEELATYSALDYTMAVGQVTRFVASVVGANDPRLSGPWDLKLSQAIKANRASP